MIMTQVLFPLLSILLPLSSSHEKIPEASSEVLEKYHQHLPSPFKVHLLSDNTRALSSSSFFSANKASLCIPWSSSISSSDKFALSSSISHLSPTQVLTVRVLYEKLNSTSLSLSNLFINSLESEVLHFGSFTKAHLKVFEKVNFHEVDVKSFIEADEFTEVYRALEKVKPLDEEMLSYSSYLWASHHVNSKKIYWTERNVLVMVPFIELVKHDSNGNESIRFDNGSFCVFSHKDVKPGEIIVRDFGKLSTLEYFRKFGKVLKNNVNDFFVVENEGKKVKLFGNLVSEELVERFGDGVEGWGKYRKFLLKSVNVSLGIREVRRKIVPYQDHAIKEILKYGIEIRKTLYNHLKLVDLKLISEFSKIFFK
jgi:hypothetical protein